MPFSPRLAGECRDRTRNADGSPRTDLPGRLPLLTDDQARWYFSMEPDAAPADVDELPALDDAHAAEWRAYCSTLTRPEHGAPRDVGPRWWCGCGAFARGQSTPCARCGDNGPHVFSEDNPCTGNADRRARLRAKHRATRTIHH